MSRYTGKRNRSVFQVEPAFTKARRTYTRSLAPSGTAIYPSQRGYLRRTGEYRRFGSRRAGGGGERKFLDTQVGAGTPVTIAATGTIVNNCLNVIANGTGPSDRIGRSVRVKALYFKGRLLLIQTDAEASTSNRIRIIVYQDMQTNGAAATVADILEDADVDSYYNLDNTGRFRFLYDKTHQINAQAGAYNGTNDEWGEVQKNIKMSFPMLNTKLEFNNTTGAINEVRTNNYGCIAIADTSSTVNLAGRWRIRYADE